MERVVIKILKTTQQSTYWHYPHIVVASHGSLLLIALVLVPLPQSTQGGNIPHRRIRSASLQDSFEMA